MGTQIDLIVGLGNPGAEYEATRHNAGFWFVDLLAREHGGSFSHARKLHGDSAEIKIAGHRVRLLKPMTYMNLSGQSVGAAVNYFKIPTENVLVAYDELDLPPGRVQLRFDGGGAGHNGIGNVMEHIGRKFWRLRFGVGHPRDKAQPSGDRSEVVDHVLKRANETEDAAIRDTLRQAADILPVLFDQGGERAMNRLHTRKPPAEPDADSKETK
jgi:PTH1 family peptidyl-tRNA hydrolase